MASAVVEVEPRVPQRLAGEGIELRSRNTFGKHGALGLAAGAATGLGGLGGDDLGELAFRRFLVEPGEKAGKRRRIAQMSVPRALELNGILDRLHQGDRV